MEHTKGAWSINGNKIDGNGYHIAIINSHATKEGKANAILMSSAPDLIVALRDCEARLALLVHSGRSKLLDAVAAENARAAIAKATSK